MAPLVRDATTSAAAAANSLGSLMGDETQQQLEDRIKCVLIGDGAIGKTSLIVSYTTNGYPTEYVPTAYDNYNVIVTVDTRPLRLQLCDTPGQDDFDSLRPFCYPGVDVFLLCFSVVSPASFHNIRDKWIPEIRQHTSNVPIILVGTQSDLRNDVKVLIELAHYGEQPVTEAAARRLAQQIGAASYIESSALTQKNLKEVFDTAIVVALRRNQESQGKSRFRILHRDRQNGGTKKKNKQQQQQQQQQQELLQNTSVVNDVRHPPLALTSAVASREENDNPNNNNMKKRRWFKYCCFS